MFTGLAPSLCRYRRQEKLWENPSSGQNFSWSEGSLPSAVWVALERSVGPARLVCSPQLHAKPCFPCFASSREHSVNFFFRGVLRMEQEDHGGRINDQRVLSPLRRAPGVVLLFKMISQGFKTLSVAVKRGGIKWDPCSTATSRVWRRYGTRSCASVGLDTPQKTDTRSLPLPPPAVRRSKRQSSTLMVCFLIYQINRRCGQYYRRQYKPCFHFHTALSICW